MQANREMCFQKKCTKLARMDGAFMDTFIANAVENGNAHIP